MLYKCGLSIFKVCIKSISKINKLNLHLKILYMPKKWKVAKEFICWQTLNDNELKKLKKLASVCICACACKKGEKATSKFKTAQPHTKKFPKTYIHAEEKKTVIETQNHSNASAHSHAHTHHSSLTVIEGNQKAPFSIATTLGCRGGHYSFP